jgi:hypothetical protein
MHAFQLCNTLLQLRLLKQPLGLLGVLGPLHVFERGNYLVEGHYFAALSVFRFKLFNHLF